jgi:catecholate siderophore receptor
VRVLFGSEREDRPFELPFLALSGAAASLTALGAAPAALAQSQDAQAGETHAAGAQSADFQATDADADSVSGVVVTGVRPLMGDKIPLTLQDAPQSVNVLPQKLLQAQGITRLQDALRNVPGITLNAGEGAARGDTVNLRGFSAFNDFFLDGIRDAAVYNRDTFDLQQVEVLKGPSATLFGRGSTGGVINQVSKAPGLEAFRDLTVEGGGNDEIRGELDIDQPLSATSAVRLNAMGESSSVAGRDFVQNRRWGIAPAATFGIGEPTTVTLAYMHLSEDDRPDTGVPFVNGAPAPVPREADFGLLSDRAKSDVDIGTLVIQHQLNANISLENSFRAADYSFNYIFNSPNFGSVASGGQGAPTPGTPLSSILVGRDSPSSGADESNVTDQLDVTFRFDTGPVRHVLVTGVEVSWLTNDLFRYANPFNTNNNWIPETPLLAPNPNMVRPFEPVTTTQNTDADSEAAYVTDTMKLGEHFDLIAGARIDRFAASFHQVSLTSGAVLNLAHTDVVGSPRVALVYKPIPNTSLYIAYGTSFDPSAEALTLTTKTANLGPVKATDYEAGFKSTVLNGGLLLTGAVFHTVVDNAQTNDPDNPTITVLNGNERVQGLELGATGHITERLEIVAGYTYLDGKTISSGTPSAIGKEIPNLARNAVNVWAEYYVTPAWEVGFGGNYLDKRFADAANTATAPAATVWNAMTSYRISPRLTAQLNVNNLFDKLYYGGIYFTSASENHAIPAPGRTVKVALRASF